MKLILKLLCVTMVLTGCATSYKPNGIIGNGGFEDVELAPNYFRVSFKGNEKTSSERAKDLAILRASDLMIERSCPSFIVLKSKEDTQKGGFFLPQTQTTNTTATSYGRTVQGNAVTSTIGGGFVALNFPKITIEAKCSTDLPDLERGIYDTKFINKSLKLKYKIEK